MESFDNLLRSMMSEDNNRRVQAETIWNQTKERQPNEMMQALLQFGRTSAEPDLRAFCIVLLRRNIIMTSKASLWKSLDQNVQALIKGELLNGIEREENPLVRSNLCDTTFELASDIFDAKETWNELLDWLLRMSASTEAHHRESSLQIFANLSGYMVDAFADKFPIIKNLLVSGLNDPTMKVKLAALNATTNFVQVFVAPEFRSELQALIPCMLDILANALNQKDEDSAQTALKLFIELGELDPGFIKPSVSPVIGAMLKIAQATELDDSTRQLAVEFLVTFVENKPNMCRQISGLTQSLITLLLHMMLEIEDESLPAWNQRIEDDDALEILNNVVAQENLDRVCLALTGETVVPVIFEHIPALLANTQDWRYRHVGLMAISMIGEGCREYLTPHLEKIVNMILPLFDDEHPRVRWAATNTAGQMSTDFGPKFQKMFHAQILPRFAKLMMDVQNPKVQSHTAAAIINFCEKFDQTLVGQYLPLLLEKLMELVKSNTGIVQEQAITAIASLAGCAQKQFVQYYDTFIPLLKGILNNATAKEHRSLRGKAMECISLIGVAVGKEKFMDDAIQVMELLAQAQSQHMDSDDPQREYMLQTWTRISMCLGELFVPYLKYVMPPLIQAASLDAGVHILDQNNTNDEEEGWEYVSVGETRIAIHTAALEEKANACNMLYCYASEMKDGFFPYVEQVSKILVPLMNFYYHDGVRLAALSTMPALLQSAKIFLEKNNQPMDLLNQLFNFIFPPLIDSVNTELDPEVLVVAIESVHESIDVMGPNCLPTEKVGEMVKLLISILVASQNRRQELMSKNPDGDLDDSFIIREELVKEDDIMCELAEVVGALVKHHPDAFLAAFSELAPIAINMLKGCPSERQLAICIFDDLVEHTQDRSFFLFQHFLPAVMENATDPHHGVRQAAVYGLGVCAQHGGELFKPLVPKTLEILISVINKPDSRVEKSAPPTENAISSVGKLIQFQSSSFPDKVMELADMWLHWLPIEVDTIEAKVVHQQLCHFIKSNNTLIFGPNYKNLSKVLSIFSSIVDTDLVNAEITKSIVEILQQMQQTIPGEILQLAFHSLPSVNQQKLQVLLQQRQ